MNLRSLSAEQSSRSAHSFLARVVALVPALTPNNEFDFPRKPATQSHVAWGSVAACSPIISPRLTEQWRCHRLPREHCDTMQARLLTPAPRLQVTLVKTADAIEVLQKPILHRRRRSLSPLPSPTRISFLVESMSFTRGRKHFISRSPNPLEEHCHDPRYAVKGRQQQRFDLRSAQHHLQPALPLGSRHFVEPSWVNSRHLLAQEKNRRHCPSPRVHSARGRLQAAGDVATGWLER